MSDSIKELQEKIVAFRDDRNWKQFHNPKDLAISITLEAAELLEVFQWSATFESVWIITNSYSIRYNKRIKVNTF